MSDAVRTLGVLVAGGVGARLGLGLPKALARVGGMTLLERGLRTLTAVCDEIVVAAPADVALSMPLASVRGRGGREVVRVDDPPGFEGPLAGVVTGLSSRPFERALVLAVDLPFATPAALAALVARLGRRQAVLPVPGGFPQPLAAAYAASAGPLLAARLEAGERSIVRAVDALDAERLDDEELGRLPGGLENFFNLNTREDLAEAERRLSAREAAR
jgi:molybdopterin-guanine dinucleotide biosynthesis protein A